jgi:hypothetical protein
MTNGSGKDRELEPGEGEDAALEATEEAATEELRRLDSDADAHAVDLDDEDGELDVPGPRADSEQEMPDVIGALPAIARLAAKAWLRSAVWGVGTTFRISTRLARAAVDPRAAAELAYGVGAGMRHYAREFLGISDLEARVEQAAPRRAGTGPATAARARRARRGSDGPPSPEVSLRLRGAELLRQSADVGADDQAHPAYAQILNELSPDETRILRLLASEGPQPAVDVRAANLIGVGSQLVARELNMVGAEAGCRHPDRIPLYLNNLQRLGLVYFSDEPIEDPIRYQVLEAQPEVLEAIKRATRAKSIQRSLRLTPFGEGFCDVCLPLDTDEVQELTEPD